MTQKARSAVVVEPGKMEIQEFDLPEIGREDGLLKVEMVGVCGTDPGIFSGKVRYGTFPLVLGHELLGHIDRVGNVAKSRWGVKEGDRVVLEAMIRCGYCEKCITGDYRFCKHQSYYGCGMMTTPAPHPHLAGGYGDYLYLHPGAVMHHISESVPPEVGILINAVIADELHWVRHLGNPFIGDTVVIQGAGPQGLVATAIAKESGCQPIIVTGLSRDSERFKLAKEFGADHTVNVEEQNVVEFVRELTNGKMADLVVDLAGSPQAILTSFELIKTQGTVVLPSVTGSDVTTPVIFDRLVHRDIKVIGVLGSDARFMDKSIRLAETGKYPFKKIVSHIFSLEEAEKAVRTAGLDFEGVYPIKCAIKP